MVEDDGTETLERLKVRRERLADAADDLEQAITRAAGEPETWRDEVRTATQEVRAALADHVEEVESPGGLYVEIAAGSPRLLPTVQRLRREHDTLADRIDGLETLLSDGSVDDVREAALGLLTEISRHRHRGADLLWEFYDVDIGGG